MLFTHYVVTFLAIINCITFFIFWYDKHLSLKESNPPKRISENTLLLFSFISLGIGAMIAMQLFRHKTIKTSFQIKFWAIISLEYTALVYYFFI